jgi:hypothetical protein
LYIQKPTCIGRTGPVQSVNKILCTLIWVGRDFCLPLWLQLNRTPRVCYDFPFCSCFSYLFFSFIWCCVIINTFCQRFKYHIWSDFFFCVSFFPFLYYLFCYPFPISFIFQFRSAAFRTVGLEALTVALLKIQIFCDVRVCHCESISWCFMMFLLELLDPKSEGIIIIRKNRSYSTHYTVSHSRRLASLTFELLWTIILLVLKKTGQKITIFFQI